MAVGHSLACCILPYVAQMRAQERDEQRAHTLESDEEDDEEAREAGTYELKDVDLHEELDDKVIPSSTSPDAWLRELTFWFLFLFAVPGRGR